MKLELVVPATEENLRHRRKALTPPLGMATVAALTPPDVAVSLADENVTTVDLDVNADLVGISALTYTAKRAYEIADAFRTRGVKVVMGGIHPSVMPEETLQHADAVVVGEAEGLWPGVIDDFRANTLRRVYAHEKPPSVVGLPTPRRELYKEGAYYFKNTLWATRGCPYSCSFCSVSAVFGRGYRCRPVDEVMREIDGFGRARVVGFMDDNIAANPRFAKELFRALAPRKVRWVGQASVSIAGDEELLKLAADSGCVELMIGFESLSQASLATVGKKSNVVEEYERVVSRIHAHDISIHAFFIVGLDEDEEDIFERTLRFAQKAKLESAHFGWPVPHPGTAFTRAMDDAGRVVTKDWSRYEYDLVFQPRLMSRETLRQRRSWVWRQFYSLPSIWRRLGARHRFSVPLWALNLYYRSVWRRRNLEERKEA
jgi:radical SAM superfamily enzyme YgiQ (UPF0313 family)